jgi:hypothetical protein
METRLLGRATFDRAGGRFTDFALLAVGTRRGQSRAPYIGNDTGSGEIGFAFVPAEDTPADRVAPAFFPAYGWFR